ncbi:MAG: hypothetical protein R3C45_14515 [Phycisphaerales bacterium]
MLRTWSGQTSIRGEPTFATCMTSLREGEAELLDDLLHQNAVRFRKGRRTMGLIEPRSGEQAKLLLTLARAGMKGLVRVPHDPTRAAALHRTFKDWLEERDRVLNQLIGERTGDEELQERVFGLVTQQLALT